MFIIFILSVGPTGPEVSDFWPYAVHFIEYAILGMLLYRAIVYTWDIPPVRVMLYATVAAFAYGAVMELAQLPLDHRGFGVDDMFANLAGATVGAVAYGFSRIRILGSHRDHA